MTKPSALREAIAELSGDRGDNSESEMVPHKVETARSGFDGLMRRIIRAMSSCERRRKGAERREKIEERREQTQENRNHVTSE